MGNGICGSTTEQTEDDRRITDEIHEAQRRYQDEIKLLLLGN
jgi:hypothetical protein